MKRQVSYQSTHSYETLNQLTEQTKHIWIVFHGIGYLSRYFLKYFEQLPPDENFIVAPQAPSKYYLDERYKHVGASWLTKVDTKQEIANILSYLDAVYLDLKLPQDRQLIVLGYSQGVSIAARWVARRQIKCDKLVLYAGGIPEELETDDFEFLPETSQILMVYGDKDPYLTSERLKHQKHRLHSLFGSRSHIRVFRGGHEVVRHEIERILKI